MKEAKKLFSITLDLNYEVSEDRHLFRRLMALIDPERNKIVFRDRIIQFFDCAGFLHIELLEQE